MLKSECESVDLSINSARWQTSSHRADFHLFYFYSSKVGPWKQNTNILFCCCVLHLFHSSLTFINIHNHDTTVQCSNGNNFDLNSVSGNYLVRLENERHPNHQQNRVAFSSRIRIRLGIIHAKTKVKCLVKQKMNTAIGSNKFASSSWKIVAQIPIV